METVVSQSKKAKKKDILDSFGSKKETVIQGEIIAYLNQPHIQDFCFTFRQQNVGIYDPIARTYRFPYGIGRIRGVSDILGVVGTCGIDEGLMTGLGRFLAIEVKSVNGKLSPEQATFLMQINNRGGIGIVARCVEDVEDCFRREGYLKS
jgi:hypothetical protein